MSWRNPVTSLPANAITSGTFGGNYVNAGSFTLAGNPAASHVQATASALTFYASDGVTPLITLDTTTGAGTIIGGTIETASSGKRWVLSSPGTVDTLQGYTGDAQEAAPAVVSVSTASGAVHLPGLLTKVGAPQSIGGLLKGGLLTLSASAVGYTGSRNVAELQADVVQVFARIKALGGTADIWARDDLFIAPFSATVGATAGQSPVSFGVTFPVAPTCVFVQMYTNGGQPIVTGITTTGFTLRTWSATGVPTTTGTVVTGAMIVAVP